MRDGIDPDTVPRAATMDGVRTSVRRRLGRCLATLGSSSTMASTPPWSLPRGAVWLFSRNGADVTTLIMRWLVHRANGSPAYSRPERVMSD